VAQLKYQLQQAFERSQAPLGFAPIRPRWSASWRLPPPPLPGQDRDHPPGRPGQHALLRDRRLAGGCTEDEQGRELILAYISRGQFIGEMGLFVEQAQRESMVRTRTPCEMAEISYERLFQLMEGPLREDVRRSCSRSAPSSPTACCAPRARSAGWPSWMSPTASRTLLDLCQEPDSMTHLDGTQIRISRQEVSRIVGCSREWSAACSSSSKSSA
jgi:cAMP-binding proteins - catabolite gene activator and regulatory subunit of cAMP-dependent protein kinases